MPWRREEQRLHAYRADLRIAVRRYRLTGDLAEKYFIEANWPLYVDAVKSLVAANAASQRRGDKTMTEETNEKAFYRELGRRVGDTRRACGFTQLQLADQMGLTFQQIQKYEQGKSRLSLFRLLQICRILDVSLTLFLGDQDVRLIALPGLTAAEEFLLRDYRKNPDVLQQTVAELVETGARWSDANQHANDCSVSVAGAEA